MTIPVQLDQLLTLAFSTVLVTQALKWVAGKINLGVGGKGSVVVSAVVAVLLTLLAYGAGWVTLAIPACSSVDVFGCAEGWIAVAGAATALANVLYVVVYSRVFGPQEG
jgi:hypothetical protein